MRYYIRKLDYPGYDVSEIVLQIGRLRLSAERVGKRLIALAMSWRNRSLFEIVML